MKSRNRFLPLAIIVALAVLPHVMGPVKTNIFIQFAIGAVYAVSLNLLLSFTGLLSFGHALFFGTGAYATALALTHIQGLTIVPSVMLGALAAAAIALIVSPLLVRVTGTAFAMLTLAFGQLMFILCLKFREITGGEDGIAGYPVPNLSLPGVHSVDMADSFNFYYFAIAVSGLCIFVMWHITKTPLGSIMVAIRDNTQRVDFLGFRVPFVKAIVFVISGAFAGIAGSLFALSHSVVSTDGVFQILVSFFPLMAILVGGIGSFWGPVIGCGVLTLVQEFTLRYTERAELVSGLVFVLVILFMPYGAAGFWRMLGARRRYRSADGHSITVEK